MTQIKSARFLQSVEVETVLKEGSFLLSKYGDYYKFHKNDYR